jgi:O-antigen/teichoic acid export membrane protein
VTGPATTARAASTGDEEPATITSASRTRRNLLAGVAASIGSALIGLAVVPVYLRHLGLEAYGVIAILTTAQALFSVLDMGLAPAVNREVARGLATGEPEPSRLLLYTLERVYGAMALGIALVAVFAAPLIATGWLRSNTLEPSALATSLTLIGIVVACRWPVGLYLGVLLGAQRAALSSGIALLSAVLGSVGAALIVAVFSQRLETLFAWLALTGLLQAFAMRAAAWRCVGKPASARMSLPALRQIWRFSAGLSGIAVTALLLTQVDKIILSRSLPLAGFAEYALATLVVSGLYLCIGPVFNVIYPMFSTLVVRGDTPALLRTYRNGTRLAVSFLFPVATVPRGLRKRHRSRLDRRRGACGERRTRHFPARSRDRTPRRDVLPVCPAAGPCRTRLPLAINLLLVVVSVPLTATLATLYGAVGGGLAWLALYVFYTVVGSLLTHRYVLRKAGPAWLLRDVGLPFVASVVIGGACHLLVLPTWPAGPSRIVVAAGLLATLFAVYACVAPRVWRNELCTFLSLRAARPVQP